MDLAAIAIIVGIFNIILIGLNAFMILNIKLAVSVAIAKSEAKIAEDRRLDTLAVHEAIRDAAVSHSLSRKTNGSS